MTNSLKLWVDDERPAPDDSWVHAKTSESAISHLYMAGVPAIMDDIEEISLDHDLGGDDTGFKVLDWMISWDCWPKELTIHTSNRAARERMLAAANAEAPEWVNISIIYDHLRKA